MDCCVVRYLYRFDYLLDLWLVWFRFVRLGLSLSASMPQILLLGRPGIYSINQQTESLGNSRVFADYWVVYPGLYFENTRLNVF